MGLLVDSADFCFWAAIRRNPHKSKGANMRARAAK
jgi:hypothetical protein